MIADPSPAIDAAVQHLYAMLAAEVGEEATPEPQAVYQLACALARKQRYMVHFDRLVTAIRREEDQQDQESSKHARRHV